jgi:hypothetical protein
VKSGHLPKADQAIEFLHRLLIALAGSNVIACGKKVTGVQTNAGAIGADPFQEIGQMFKPVSQAAPLARRVFQKNPKRRSDRVQRAPKRSGHPRNPCRNAGPDMCSRVQHQARDSKKISPLHLFNKSINGFPIQIGLRGCEVYQVTIVRQDCLDRIVPPRFAEQYLILLGQQLRFPLVAVLEEDLYRPALQSRTPFESLMQAPGDRNVCAYRQFNHANLKACYYVPDPK